MGNLTSTADQNGQVLRLLQYLCSGTSLKCFCSYCFHHSFHMGLLYSAFRYICLKGAVLHGAKICPQSCRLQCYKIQWRPKQIIGLIITFNKPVQFQLSFYLFIYFSKCDGFLYGNKFAGAAEFLQGTDKHHVT